MGTDETSEVERLKKELASVERQLRESRRLLERVQQLLVRHQFLDTPGHDWCPECELRNGDDGANKAGHAVDCEWFAIMSARK